MNKIDKIALRFSLIAIAAILITTPTLFGLFSAQQSNLDRSLGNTLAQRLAIESTEAILADDILALNATLASYQQVDKVAGASFLDSAGDKVSASGDLEGLAISAPVMISGDEYGSVFVYIVPYGAALPVVAILLIVGLICLLSFIGYRAAKQQQPKPVKEPDSGTLVTLELGDLPGLADQLSAHTINNLYGELQNQVEALFTALGGQLYLAQGPVLRGLFFNENCSKRAAKAALMLKRLTNRWAAEQGVSINRRIAVQDAPTLNLNGS